MPEVSSFCCFSLTTVLIVTLATSLPLITVAAEDTQPCRDDVVSLCGDSIGNREGMRACMREKFSQLSEQCQDRIKERQQQRSQSQGGQGRGQQGSGVPGSESD